MCSPSKNTGTRIVWSAAWLLPSPWSYIAAAAAFLLGAVTFLLLRSDVALLGSLLVLLAVACVLLFRQNGFRILLGIVATAIVVSPVVLSAAAPIAVKADMPLGSSTKSRLFAWSLASKKIAERPLIGHGIEASKEWRETFADEPDLLKIMEKSTDLEGIPWEQYRILPGHPHNMGLQLWAEVGLVGVALACLILLLIALALPPPAVIGAPVAVAIASLIAAAFSLFSLSYSLWNEAFWASVALSAAGVTIFARLRKPA